MQKITQVLGWSESYAQHGFTVYHLMVVLDNAEQSRPVCGTNAKFFSGQVTKQPATPNQVCRRCKFTRAGKEALKEQA